MKGSRVVVAYTRVDEMQSWQLAQVSQAENMRADRFTAQRRKRQFLCGRVLLRMVLERFTGNPAESHELISNGGGKLICINGPAVSITHSGNSVACAVASSGEIGIDIEVPDRQRKTPEIARNYFSAEEAQWLETQPEDRFYMMWVLKEAYVKAIGCGLRGLDYLRCKIEPPRIEASAADGLLQGLGLYSIENAFLGLAARHTTLGSVAFEHWIKGRKEPITSTEFQNLATTYVLA